MKNLQKAIFDTITESQNQTSTLKFDLLNSGDVLTTHSTNTSGTDASGTDEEFTIECSLVKHKCKLVVTSDGGFVRKSGDFDEIFAALVTELVNEGKIVRKK